MSRSSPEVTISTDVMMWLCGSSGYSAAEISRKTGIRERIIQSWCEGTGKPALPLAKVEMLAALFRRPLAAFLLSRPLDEPDLPKDFRRHPDSAPAFSNDLLLAIRKARRIQQIHHELTDNLNQSSRVQLKTRTLNERWCNHFAGAFLAPKDEIEQNALIQSSLKSGNFMRAAASLQKYFLISKEAGLMRFLTLELIPSSQFRRGRDQLREEFAAREAKKKERKEAGEEDEGDFEIFLDRKCVAEKGAGYVSLIMKNVRKGHITSSDAIDYLDVKLKS